jgi:disulfide bond formation protein DsbB
LQEGFKKDAIQKPVMSFVQSTLSYATLLVNISWITGLALYAVYRSPIQSEKVEKTVSKVSEVLTSFYREISLIFVAAATSGSLYFSQVLGWEPCLMCWYQRILMYPLVLIFGVAVILEKPDVEDYALPIALMGSGLSFYHYLVQRIEAFQSSGCSVTQISCETQYTYYFDYITVPMMAFTVFLTVAVLNWKFSE